MGANGAGKSTFFLCLNGIHKPSSGTLYLDGEPADYSKKDFSLCAKVGIVFRTLTTSFSPLLSLQEISFGALNMGMSPEKAREEVAKVIDSLEITPFQEKPTHSLSGGQKKQVSIADVLVMNPEVIILDEPASSLDPKHTVIVDEIVNLLVERGITVLMSTHNVDYALKWADEIVVIDGGKTLIHDTPVSVFSNEAILKQANLKNLRQWNCLKVWSEKAYSLSICRFQDA